MEQQGLRAGAAKVEVTPALGGPMAGYFHERRSTGVLDPLYARALVLEAEVQVLRLGDAALVTSPGEMFAQYALDVKRKSPGESPTPSVIVPVSLANGYCGYVPTREAFRQGGYETWLARSSFVAPESGDEWLRVARRLLHSVESATWTRPHHQDTKTPREGKG